jgi:hypothetical protein
MGFRVWLAKEGCLKYSTIRTDLQEVSKSPSGECQTMRSGWVHGTKWGVSTEQPSSNLQSLPPWQISVRGTQPSNFTPEPWRSARTPSTDKTDPRHSPYRNLEMSSSSCSCSPYCRVVVSGSVECCTWSHISSCNRAPSV